MTPDWHHTFSASLAQLGPARAFTEVLRHGSMSVELYAPRGHDPQQPHAQDELYVVQRGSGTFRRGEETVPFGPGDVLFVPARMPHRFERFSAVPAIRVIASGAP
ncbi:MAG TPA: cupin domain-containing protein [Archangium sp.]|nr:cupin domain-containing protein [Archangium sp.]